jgi:sigma-B regulation protein RsbU (phosphoserine phosphatase)
VLYSDGITEAANADDEEYGSARLAEHLASSDASKESLLHSVRTFVNDGGLQDDATVILVRSNSGPCTEF